MLVGTRSAAREVRYSSAQSTIWRTGSAGAVITNGAPGDTCASEDSGLASTRWPLTTAAAARWTMASATAWLCWTSAAGTPRAPAIAPGRPDNMARRMSNRFKGLVRPIFGTGNRASNARHRKSLPLRPILMREVIRHHSCEITIGPPPIPSPRPRCRGPPGGKCQDKKRWHCASGTVDPGTTAGVTGLKWGGSDRYFISRAIAFLVAGP